MTIRRFATTCCFSIFAATLALAQPSPSAVSAFNSYAHSVEERLAGQRASRSSFLAPPASGRDGDTRLRDGELITEQLTPEGGDDLPGALLHDWRGTAFAAGAKAADFARLMQDFGNYPRTFSPQVLRARVVAQQGERYQVLMRLRQQHGITVVMDAKYDVVFGRLDAQHGHSLSRSTGIAEIGSPGSRDERPLSPSREHGFLWRMNTYWSYEERDGGLYIQIESVTLTRSIPRGLGWVIGPYVQSVPRESLEFTLSAVCSALKNQATRNGEKK